MRAIRDARFTRRDYMELPEGFPAQLIDGGLVKEPAPTYRHQTVVVKIAARLEEMLRGCDRVLVAPVDVFIDDWNVLQPDVAVLAPEDAVRPGRKSDAIPVLVIEILSPSTATRDRDVKTGHYLRAGVAEVWLVDPDALSIDVHTRDAVAHFAPDDEAASRAVPGFTLRGADLAPRG